MKKIIQIIIISSLLPFYVNSMFNLNENDLEKLTFEYKELFKEESQQLITKRNITSQIFLRLLNVSGEDYRIIGFYNYQTKSVKELENFIKFFEKMYKNLNQNKKKTLIETMDQRIRNLGNIKLKTLIEYLLEFYEKKEQILEKLIEKMEKTNKKNIEITINNEIEVFFLKNLKNQIYRSKYWQTFLSFLISVYNNYKANEEQYKNNHSLFFQMDP